ncbi:MAG: glycosyltransferase [Candidatus Gottesmanbacteria bacterium]
MRIGILIPSIYASKKHGEGRIFAPLPIAVSLAEGLALAGHTVCIYTSKDVQTTVSVIPGDSDISDKDLTYFQFRNRDVTEQNITSVEIIKRDFEYDLTLKAYKDALAGNLDILHSFHDFGAHYFNELSGFPTVYTLHDPLPISEDTIEYQRLSKFQHHNYVSISNSQRIGKVRLHFVDTVYHGIHLSKYIYSEQHENHLIHFGRIMEDKGTDDAIKVAALVHMSLQIATSTIRGNRSAEFYNTKIAPLIDGKQISSVGFLENEEKSRYIGGGKAFLFPLKWEEPFGLVMIEAMACGTPVIAYNRGSVPEVVKDGVTGFIIDQDDEDRPGKGSWVIKKQGIEGLVEAVKRIGEIDRLACRKHVEEHFTVEKMVTGYEAVYKQILKK